MSLSKIGIPCSEETKRKISLTNNGKKNSKESIKKMSITRKRLFKEGKLIHPMYGKHHSEDSKRKIGISNTGKKRTKQFRENISRIRKSQRWSEKTKRKIGEANSIRMKSLWKKEEYRKKQRKSQSISCIKAWKNEKFRNKKLKSLFKGMNLKPNKPEKMVIKIIQENNLFFNYVGDGKFLIGGFNPDFIDKERKLIIELFGDYWHNRPEVKERDERRFKAYSREGYNFLVIWEHELKDIPQTSNKIKRFLQNGNIKIEEGIVV